MIAPVVGRVGFEPTNRVAGLIYSQLALTTCIPTQGCWSVLIQLPTALYFTSFSLPMMAFS